MEMGRPARWASRLSRQLPPILPKTSGSACTARGSEHKQGLHSVQVLSWFAANCCPPCTPARASTAVTPSNTKALGTATCQSRRGLSHVTDAEAVSWSTLYSGLKRSTQWAYLSANIRNNAQAHMFLQAPPTLSPSPDEPSVGTAKLDRSGPYRSALRGHMRDQKLVLLSLSHPWLCCAPELLPEAYTSPAAGVAGGSLNNRVLSNCKACKLPTHTNIHQYTCSSSVGTGDELIVHDQRHT